MRGNKESDDGSQVTHGGCVRPQPRLVPVAGSSGQRCASLGLSFFLCEAGVMPLRAGEAGTTHGVLALCSPAHLQTDAGAALGSVFLLYRVGRCPPCPTRCDKASESSSWALRPWLLLLHGDLQGQLLGSEAGLQPSPAPHEQRVAIKTWGLEWGCVAQGTSLRLVCKVRVTAAPQSYCGGEVSNAREGLRCSPGCDGQLTNACGGTRTWSPTYRPAGLSLLPRTGPQHHKRVQL